MDLAPERRDDSYTDALIQLLTNRANGLEASTDTLAVAEIAAGLWARAFATANVTPVTPATAALTPDVLAAIGRALALRGEYLGELYVDGGELRVRESCSWDVAGDLEGWTYRADFPTPAASRAERSIAPVSCIRASVSTGRVRGRVSVRCSAA